MMKKQNTYWIFQLDDFSSTVFEILLCIILTVSTYISKMKNCLICRTDNVLFGLSRKNEKKNTFYRY